MPHERKIINDPVFGFINIPKGLLYDIVRHPLLQRLNRIKQVGLSSVVYPGAQHTRFQHSLGAFYLMSEAITQLASKGNFIFDSEAEAVQAAILLHDIGHGPFSHVLEDTIVKGVSHEEISLMLMERMNREMNGQLSLAIQIFKDEYPKTRYISLGSMVLVISYAILVSVFKGLWPAGVWAIALALIAIWRHWGNLQRLKNGTERKIGQKEENKA